MLSFSYIPRRYDMEAPNLSTYRYFSLPDDMVTEEDTPGLGQRRYTIATEPDFLAEIPPGPKDLPPINTRKRAHNEYESYMDDKLIDDQLRYLGPLHFDTNECSDRGNRPSMEDCFIDCEFTMGRLIGVFDGHGIFDPVKAKHQIDQDGLKMAKTAALSAKQAMGNFIHKNNYNIPAAFREWADCTNKNLPVNDAGTTAALAFIDKVENILYVANIGDSATFVFRKQDGNVYAIPMSPIINWETPACAERVRKVLSPEEFKLWESLRAKNRRVAGLNLSNTLGDHKTKMRAKGTIDHSPVISQLRLLPNDLILCGCDGLWDYVQFKKLETKFAKVWDNPKTDFAKLAVDLAFDHETTDNVTVIAAKVLPGQDPKIQRSRSTALTQPLDSPSI